MDGIHELIAFIEFLLLFALGVLALFIVALIYVSRLPGDNPLKIIMVALSKRLGATGALMIVDPAATAVPVIGEMWDLATVALLIYFWFTFLRQLPGMYAVWKASPYASAPSRTTPLSPSQRPQKPSLSKQKPPTRIGRR
jgi:hypothetical protein